MTAATVRHAVAASGFGLPDADLQAPIQNPQISLLIYRVLGTEYNDENCSILHEEFITGKCRRSFDMPFKIA